MPADRERDRNTDIGIDVDIQTFSIVSGVWTLQGCEPQPPTGPGAARCHSVAWPGALTSILCFYMFAKYILILIFFFLHLIPTSPWSTRSHRFYVAKPDSNVNVVWGLWAPNSVLFLQRNPAWSRILVTCFDLSLSLLSSLFTMVISKRQYLKNNDTQPSCFSSRLRLFLSTPAYPTQGIWLTLDGLGPCSGLHMPWHRRLGLLLIVTRLH